MASLRLIAIGVILAFPSHALALDILRGSLGNADFNAGGISGGTQKFQATPHWHNIGKGANTAGNEGLDFTKTNAVAGSSDPAHMDLDGNGTKEGRAAEQRPLFYSANDTSYTIQAAGEVFSLTYDFGTTNDPNRWEGDEVMRFFLFSMAPDVGNNYNKGSGNNSQDPSLGLYERTTEKNLNNPDPNVQEFINIDDNPYIATDAYQINRLNDSNPDGDPQWTIRDVPNFYTTTESDIGTEVYLGMHFTRGPDGDDEPVVWPRIDNIILTVRDASAGLVGDFNNDGLVDLADYTVWRDNLGAADSVLPPGTTDDGSGFVDGGDYASWKANFGQPSSAIATLSVSAVPEPWSGTLLAGCVGLGLAGWFKATRRAPAA